MIKFFYLIVSNSPSSILDLNSTYGYSEKPDISLDTIISVGKYPNLDENIKRNVKTLVIDDKTVIPYLLLTNNADFSNCKELKIFRVSLNFKISYYILMVIFIGAIFFNNHSYFPS